MNKRSSVIIGEIRYVKTSDMPRRMERIGELFGADFKKWLKEHEHERKTSSR